MRGNLQFAEDTAEGAELPLNKFTPHCSLAEGAEIGSVAFSVWNLHGKATDGERKSKDVMQSLNVKHQKISRR